VGGSYWVNIWTDQNRFVYGNTAHGHLGTLTVDLWIRADLRDAAARGADFLGALLSKGR
jgi:hypothetical protein